MSKQRLVEQFVTHPSDEALDPAGLHFVDKIVIEVLPVIPALLIAVALMTWVPFVIFLPGHWVLHEVVLVHLLRVVLSPLMVIDEIPLASLAEVAILRTPLLLTVVPFTGELILTAGGVPPVV